MDFYKAIAQQASERWINRQQVREEKKQKLISEGVVGVESAERIQMRLNRLSTAASKEMAFKSTLNRPASINQSSPTSFLIENIGFERVIGKSDFLGMDFLELALAISRFVCRIHIRSSPGRTLGYGTGFMVSPRLMITNNHVLSNQAEVVNSEVEFDYQYDRFGRLLPVVNYGLEPHTFFMTDRNLDFTLVAVKEHSFNDIELKRYGWNRLIADQGKAIHTDTLNIIQHPQGEAKQIVLRSNRLVDLLDDFAHYETDTKPGSSGSPVYNDQWEVVALHHSGVPKMEHGNFIAKDGTTWREGMDPNELEWVANEGVRVSSIVNYIKKQRISPEMELLRDELLNVEPPHPFEAAAIANKDQTGKRIETGISTNSLGPNYSFTIPLNITVSVGVPIAVQPSTSLTNNIIKTDDAQRVISKRGDSTNTMPIGTATVSKVKDSIAFRDALQHLEAARRDKYYDLIKDESNRKLYYQNVQIETLNESGLYQQLHDLLKNTHTTKLTYNTARHQHLYPRVDLQSNRMLKSIYTGEEYAPEKILESDLEITERVINRAREQFSGMTSMNEVAFSEHLAFLEADAAYNAEHVVPQSWFAKRDPMKSDLHHLFTCEADCNSFRGNIPFFEFADFEEVIRQGCGKREANRFEPSKGHGAVARATLYFLLRYPKEINNTPKEYTKERIEMLISWHKKEEVTQYELHRNAEIFKVQGNRNPLIDHPKWANQIDFSLGLG